MNNTNEARYAIPGLMPPIAPRWQAHLVGPEDGSLRLLVHKGCSTDIVNYAIGIPGRKGGVVKDPSYRYSVLEHPNANKHMSQEEYICINESDPQLMSICDYIPGGTLIPKCKVRNMMIPLDEKPMPDGETAYYWILELPLGTLNPGLNMIEVVINGRVARYPVNRPKFIIHTRGDANWRVRVLLKDGDPATAKNTPVRMQAGTERKLLLTFFDESGCSVNMAAGAVNAVATVNGQQFTLATEMQETQALVVFPATLPVGSGLYKATLTMSGVEIPCAQGKLIIDSNPNQSVNVS